MCLIRKRDKLEVFIIIKEELFVLIDAYKWDII